MAELSVDQLEVRMRWVEYQQSLTNDTKRLAFLNELYQKLMDALVEKDLESETITQEN